MTVCIAALCDGGLSVVLAADRRIGMVFVEGEMESGKIRFLHEHWRAMIAADEDAAYAFEVVRKARKRLKDIPKRPSAETVKQALADAYREVRDEHITALFLPPGWTIEKFTDKGVELLGEHKYVQIVNAISEYDLKISILACGFGEFRGEILRLSDHGLVTIQTDAGFDAIGSGDDLAFAQLFERGYALSMSEQEALYYVYEAKKVAEHASGVGEQTDVMLFNWRGAATAADADLKKLDAIYKRHKPQPLSDADKKVIDELHAMKVRRDMATPSTS